MLGARWSGQWFVKLEQYAFKDDFICFTLKINQKLIPNDKVSSVNLNLSNINEDKRVAKITSRKDY